DLKWLRELAAKEDATLATTEKDFVRLPLNERNGILALPVRAVFAAEPALDALLAPLIAEIKEQQSSVQVS
ncbi:MAG: hypothetical protein ABWZ40_09275, partial [Caulobacterales bacterium]